MRIQNWDRTCTIISWRRVGVFSSHVSATARAKENAPNQESVNRNTPPLVVSDQEEFWFADVVFCLLKTGSHMCVCVCDQGGGQGYWQVGRAKGLKRRAWLATWDFSGGKFTSLHERPPSRVRFFCSRKHTHLLPYVVHYCINTVCFSPLHVQYKPCDGVTNVRLFLGQFAWLWTL